MAETYLRGTCHVNGKTEIVLLKSQGLFQCAPSYFVLYLKDELVFAKAQICRVRLEGLSFTVMGTATSGELMHRTYFVGAIGPWKTAFNKTGIVCENESVFSTDSLGGFICAYRLPSILVPAVSLGFAGIVCAFVASVFTECSFLMRGLSVFLVCSAVVWIFGSYIGGQIVYQLRSTSKSLRR